MKLMITETLGASAAPDTVIALSQSRHMATIVLSTVHAPSMASQLLEKVLLSSKTQPLGSHPPHPPQLCSQKE